MISPDENQDYYPELARNLHTGQWLARTQSYATMTLEDVEAIAEGYAKAAAMLRELAHAQPGHLAEYHVTT